MKVRVAEVPMDNKEIRHVENETMSQTFGNTQI